MDIFKLLYRFVLTNVLTVVYVFLAFLAMIWNYVKNPFGDPWAQKLRLVPPAPLTDPKYGVHKYLKVNNLVLHYVESGDPSKPLMIFIHGFPEFWYSWRYQIVEFQKDYWCIAVDMRGYGDSEKPDGVSSYKLSLLVDDIKDLVRVLGREKCILVSHDWGGLVACQFRDVYPEALSALVLLATTSKESWNHGVWSNLQQTLMSWYVFMYRAPFVPEKLLTMNSLELFDKHMLVEGKKTIDKQDIDCFKYWFGKPTAFTPPVNYYRANFSYTVDDKPQCTKPVPLLYVLAEKDRYLSVDLLESMKKEYACIETAVINNCGHFMQQEEPEKVNELIRDFLSRNNVK